MTDERDDAHARADDGSFAFLNDTDAGAPGPQEPAGVSGDAAGGVSGDEVQAEDTSAAPRDASVETAPAGIPAPTRSTGHAGVPATVRVNRRLLHALIGYCLALTLAAAALFFTGRITLHSRHPLESLPDVRPLQDNEFLRVPADADLPEGHVLRLGESRRFGDVVLTPQRVTLEPLTFAGFLSGTVEPSLTSPPVLCLWLEFRNAAADYSWPPLDASLIASRSPPDGRDASTVANSFLMIPQADAAEPLRVLNYLHLPDSNFRIVGQQSGTVLPPGESLATFIPSQPSLPADLAATDDDFRWRVQIRKGISPNGYGVTTLVDCLFTAAEIESF